MTCRIGSRTEFRTKDYRMARDQREAGCDWMEWEGRDTPSGARLWLRDILAGIAFLALCAAFYWASAPIAIWLSGALFS